MKLLPVILCGGSGTRLWPLSRDHYPKQFLSLSGSSTLFQETLARLHEDTFSEGVKLLPPLIITNERHRFLVAEQLRKIGATRVRIALEPCGRGTAPALTIAALLERTHDPIMVVMPSDHMLGDRKAFQKALRMALPYAAMGKIATFGILPSSPETGFGYILKGEPLGKCIYKLNAFVEKPDQKTAESWINIGNCLWNSGIFVMQASTWLSVLSAQNPEILSACEKALSDGETDPDFIRLGTTYFSDCPSDSIDYVVMEHLSKEEAVVIPLDAQWSDMGSWGALWEISTKDENDNVLVGDTLSFENNHCYIRSEYRLIACLGLEHLVVVETPDAVLVAHKNHLQSVKRIVSRLKQKNRPESDVHRKVFRPWGYYDSVDRGHRFQVKRIVVNPGASLSLQIHHHRAEHWIVVSGTAKITLGDRLILLSENQSTHIPLGVPHRLENPGKIPLEIIEIQSGSYLGEDDIVRLEDSYGRQQNNVP